MKRLKTLIVVVGLCSLAALYLQGCKKEQFTIETTDDVNMTGYFIKYSDSFSLFKQILDRTETSAFLNAYGAYTCFAPTNSGVSRYLQEIGASSVETANLDTLKEMVKFHLLSDTITTGSFTDGKLPLPTMLGQYIITGVENKGGFSSYFINRQAIVTKSNVKVGNGIIHEIDNVLRAAKTTLAAQIERNPDFSIFVQALKETGYYNKLNTVDPDPAKRWNTVIVETNKSLADSGINSYAALKARYSQTGNPADPKDSLNMYVAYHILPDLKYLADVIIANSHLTLLPQEVVSAKQENQRVLINDDVFNGVYEKGVELIRSQSDNSAVNGVWHTALGHFMVKFRKPQAVYWDVSAFPEIMKLPAFYKRGNYNFVKANELDRPIKDIDWHYNGASTTMNYAFSTTGSVTVNALNWDVNILPIGPPLRASWWEYNTPVIVKGRYKVWICYRTQRQSASSVCRTYVKINGVQMQREAVFTEFIPSGTDAEREAIGWKRYTGVVNNNFASRLVGTIDIATTGRQVLRFEAITGTQNTNNLDMIHFIPVDQNQILPRFNADGTLVWQ
jgi:uncharacterized surface protein with fasciclin (FAS1) repeats